MSGREPAKEGRPNKEREAEERRLRNRTEAEDLTAEVFRKALQSLA